MLRLSAVRLEKFHEMALIDAADTLELEHGAEIDGGLVGNVQEMS